MIIFVEFLSYIIERYFFNGRKTEEKMNFFRSLRKNFNSTSYVINRVTAANNCQKLGVDDPDTFLGHLWPHWLKWINPSGGSSTSPSSIYSKPVFKINSYQFHLIPEKLTLDKDILEKENFKFYEAISDDTNSSNLDTTSNGIHLFIQLEPLNSPLPKLVYYMQLDKYMKILATRDKNYMVCQCIDDVHFIKLCSDIAKFNDFLVNYNTVISNITTFKLNDNDQLDKGFISQELKENILQGSSEQHHSILTNHQSNIHLSGVTNIAHCKMNIVNDINDQNQFSINNKLELFPLRTNDRSNIANVSIKLLDQSSKPPNILIYTGSNEESTKNYTGTYSLLSHCLSRDRYAIYHLKRNQVTTTPWLENTMMLILAVNKIPRNEIGDTFLKYFLSGGYVISLSCNFDEFFLTKVKLLSEVNGTNSIVRLNYEKWKNISLVGSHHVGYDDVAPSIMHGVSCFPLASDSQSNNQMIVLANHEQSSGVAVLSQVNFEKDTSDLMISSDEFVLLKQSNLARIEIFRNILSNLGLNCEQADPPALTPCVLFGINKSCQEKFCETFENMMTSDNVYKTNKHSYKFTTSEEYLNIRNVDDVSNLIITDSTTPPLCKFNFDIYKQHLQSEILGNVVLFADVTTTTMDILDNHMLHMPDDLGLVATTSIQTNGQGRGGNIWLSPEGCAMFSLHIRLALDSPLGQHVSCVQHLVALAIVLSIRQKKGYEDIDLRIKWPNDVFFAEKLKLGGILVRSTIFQDVIHINLGCGINICNKNPTTCINDLIVQHNKLCSSELEHLDTFTVEEFIGRLITQIEKLINSYQLDGGQKFLDLYYNYWLHNDQKVMLNNVDGPCGVINGITKYGFLSVRLEDGTIVEVHPDGNSFDMMKNLIAPKI